MTDKLTKHLSIMCVGVSPSGKTHIWRVADVRGTRIGLVKWYGAWRKYCFFPENRTLYDPSCLRELADFIVDRTREHRE